MKKLISLISWLALLLIVVAPALFYSQRITLETNKLLLTAGTVAWFVSAPFWMGREKKETS